MKFSKVTNGYVTQLISEHILMQAACGPDLRKNEPVIKEAWGFADKFLSPLLVEKRPEACNSQDVLKNQSIYEMTFKNQKYTGLIAYVRDNIQTEILGNRDASGFNKWWEEKIDPQLQEAYEQYAEQYNNLMVQLIKGLHKERFSKLNLGTMANNPLDSIQQTLGTQMMVLGELTKDLAPHITRTADQEATPFFDDSMIFSTKVPLFYMMLSPGTYDWVNLVGRFDNTVEGQLIQNQKKISLKSSLVIQKEIQNEFQKMFSLINQLSIVQQNCRPAAQYRVSYKKVCTETVSSTLSNQDINDQAQAISQKIEEWKNSLLGNKESGVAPVRQLSEDNQKLVSLLIDGINGLVSELHLYASIPNAVSWEKIRDIEQSAKQQKFDQDTRLKMEQMKRTQTRGMGH